MGTKVETAELQSFPELRDYVQGSLCNSGSGSQMLASLLSYSMCVSCQLKAGRQGRGLALSLPCTALLCRLGDTELQCSSAHSFIYSVILNSIHSLIHSFIQMLNTHSG